MAEERKKMLEALVAKRKSEAEGASRSARKSKISALVSKPASVQKSSPLPYKPHPKATNSSSLLHKHKQQHPKNENPPLKKKKRVEKYDTEDDEEEDESDEDSDEEPVKKKVTPVFSAKGGSAAKASSLKASAVKDKHDTKGKTSAVAKGKRKGQESSDDDDVGSGDDDEGAAESDSGDEGLDTSNILASRTRRRGSQPMHYDFTMSGDDDDDDSD